MGIDNGFHNLIVSFGGGYFGKLVHIVLDL